MRDYWGRVITCPQGSAKLPDQALVFEPRAVYDKALRGTVYADGIQVAVYDREAICRALVEDGMTTEEAYEWISYNTEGAYLGPYTPVIIPLYDEQPCDESSPELVETAMKIFSAYVGGVIGEA